MESFLERRWARVKEILGGDMVGGWSVVGGVGTEKGADSGVPGNDDVFCHHRIPLSGKIWQRH
jgi:hypothetical protein